MSSRLLCFWLFAVLLALPSLVHAQVDSLYHKVALSVHGSDDHYEYSFLKQFNSGADFPAPISFLKTPNNTIGFSAIYYPKLRFGIRAGAFYSTKGFKIRYNQTATLSNGIVYPERTISQAHYLEVPISILQYIWMRRDFSVFLSAGAASSFYLNDTERSELENGVLYPTNFMHFSYTPWLFSTQFSLGFRYHINRKFSAQFEPYLRHYHHLFSRDIMATRAVGYGITMALSAHFGE